MRSRHSQRWIEPSNATKAQQEIESTPFVGSDIHGLRFGQEADEFGCYCVATWRQIGNAVFALKRGDDLASNRSGGGHRNTRQRVFRAIHRAAAERTAAGLLREWRGYRHHERSADPRPLSHRG